jgi:prepilin peptidase CpaA
MTDYQMNGIYMDCVLFLLLITALYYDLKSNIIPNFVTYIGIAFGLLMIFFIGTYDQIRGHLFGLVLGFGFFYVFFLFGWIGGGDVKLMGMIGLLKGVQFLIPVIVYTAIFGGVIAIGFMVYSLIRKKPVRGLKVPYGTAICLGTFTTLIIQYGIMNLK